MKFGLYTHPSTNLTFRCIDGHFDAIHYRAGKDPAATWHNIMNAHSKPVNQAVVKSKLAIAGSLYTRNRHAAAVLCGVPDDVELYQAGDFGIQA